MSGLATGWARVARVSGGPMAKAVLLLLADHANGDDACFPGVKMLAWELQTHERTVQRALATLEADGHVKRHAQTTRSGRTTSNLYELVVDLAVVEEAKRRRRQELGREGRQGAGGRRSAGGEGGAPPPPTPAQRHPHFVEAPELSSSCSDEHSARACAGEIAGEAVDEPAAAEPEPASEPPVFDQALAAWPEIGRQRTGERAARKAWRLAAEACPGGEAGLLAAVRRYVAEDRDLKRGDHGAPRLEKWLADERWRRWLGETAEGLPPGERAARIAATAVFPDAELRAVVVGAADEGFARSYLDPAAWDAERRVLTPRTGAARERLLARVGRVLAGRGVTVVASGAPAAAARVSEAVGG